jgi:hypothetical protein
MTAREIWERVKEIEDHTRYIGDEDWATHPIAVEYRSLLREWWSLPSIPNKRDD